MTLQEQVLKKIKNQNLRPTPKGYFKARDYVLWGLLGLFVAALAVSAGMIIFMVRGTDQSLFARLGLTLSERLLYSIPIFWIIVTLVAGLAAYANLRRTRRGYRVGKKQFVIAAVIIAIALGSLVYAFDGAQYIDHEAAANIPLYTTVVPLDTATWFDPEHGLLSGAVHVKTSDDYFTLRDENFNLWTVTGDHVALVPADFTFQSGDHVKIIGKKIGDFKFQAVEIRPFETPVKPPVGATTTAATSSTTGAI
ncbi:MAG: hypothetical protein KGI79_02435 [Patescibacteria group bacterium]|nr:hypothetical protein [Patescibacteria group bacterium]MDE2116710.1 hypothetical protein [Patescibacteria group bacterium]